MGHHDSKSNNESFYLRMIPCFGTIATSCFFAVLLLLFLLLFRGLPGLWTLGCEWKYWSRGLVLAFFLVLQVFVFIIALVNVLAACRAAADVFASKLSRIVPIQKMAAQLFQVLGEVDLPIILLHYSLWLTHIAARGC